MKRFFAIISLCAVLLSAGCKEPDPTPPTPPEPEKTTFQTFKLMKAQNSALTEDLTFTAGEDGVFS